MILDLTLKDNAYFLKIHKNFFQNMTVPLASFQADCPLTQKYAHLGLFHIDEPKFGFDGCFKKEGEDGDYIMYQSNFPKPDNRREMRKILLTVYLATFYVVETMFFDKEFFSENIWDDQGLSFVIFAGGAERDGHPIGGQLYPWFKRKLYSLNEEDLVRLNDYVFSELKRVYTYFHKKELHYGQVTIKRESFFIQVNLDGRWISWGKKRDANKPEEFSSHNIDFSSDQELCFVAIIAMNTWLREN